MSSRIIQALLVTIGLSLAATPVFAHEEKCDRTWGADYEHDVTSRIERHLTRLHDELKLTSNQEMAWNDFSGKMKPARMEKPDRSDWKSMSAPDRMDKMLDLMKSRETRMADRAVAVKTFYAALTSDQQKIFDRQFLRASYRHSRYSPSGKIKPDSKTTPESKAM